MLFLSREIRLFFSKTLPVGVTIDGRSVLLTEELVGLLCLCRNGLALPEGISYVEQKCPGINAESVISRLVDEGILQRGRPRKPWFGNTFGADLIDTEEYEAIKRVLDSKRLFRYEGILGENLDYLDLSPATQFERELSSLMECRYCIVLNSGTSALECALAALGAGPGKKVIVPSYSYIGVVAAVLNSGALPIICDIDESLMLCPESIKRHISDDTCGIICVHLRGVASEILSLKRIAEEKGLFLIEDCAQALGTNFQGKPVGSFGDVGCLSFHQHKIITCGEGGAVITNRRDLYERMLLISDASRLFAHRMLPGVPGHNVRMSELHATLGLVQIRKLAKIVDRLRAIYKIMSVRLAFCPGITLQRFPDPPGAVPLSVNLFCQDAGTAHAMADYLVAQGIPARVLFRPDQIDHNIYVFWPYALEMIGLTQRWNPHSDKIQKLCSESLGLLGKTVSIPIGYKITEEDAIRCADAIIHFAVSSSAAV